MRTYSQRFIALLIQCVMFTALAFGLSYTAERSLAQDVATDTPVPTEAVIVSPTDSPTELPTVVPTEVPTEAATANPTDVPTDQPTDVPTEGVTEQPSQVPTDATGTTTPTEVATQAPATPVSPDLFTEDFQDGEASGWLLTSGWSFVDDAGNTVLASTTPNDVATLTGIMWPYFTLSFRFRGALQLNFASGGSSYQFKFAPDGAVAMLKDSVLIGQSAGVTATDATIDPSTNWHTVNLLAPGNLLAVKVDDLTPLSTSDSSLVGMGPIIFGTGAEETIAAAFDDVTIKRLDAPPPMPTSVAPTEVVVIPSPTSVTQEPTLEVTSEATLEATAEATVEATTEATTEATAEATAEATLEATAEATVEPTGLSDAVRQKLPPELLTIVENYLAGNTTEAQSAAASYFAAADQLQRISITIWTADEQSAAKITGDISAANGLVTDALSIRLQALVTLDGLVALANTPEVTLIEVPALAVSTSRYGSSGSIRTRRRHRNQ